MLKLQRGSLLLSLLNAFHLSLEIRQPHRVCVDTHAPFHEHDLIFELRNVGLTVTLIHILNQNLENLIVDRLLLVLFFHSVVITHHF